MDHYSGVFRTEDKIKHKEQDKTKTQTKTRKDIEGKRENKGKTTKKNKKMTSQILYSKAASTISCCWIK